MNTQPDQNDSSESCRDAPNDAITEGVVSLGDVTAGSASEQPATDKKSAGAYNDKGGIPRMWEIRIGVFLALVNFGTLIVLIYQAAETRNATEAATDAVRQAREASHLEQRAWVSTRQVPNSDAPIIGVKWAIRIPFKNTGKTFARKVAADCQLQLVKPGNKINFQMPKDPLSGPALADLLLSPDGEYTFTFATSDPLDDKRLDLIKFPSKGRAVLFGYITYYDIFDCVHWTIFCFKFDAEHSVWEICSEHNDADNDNANDL